MLYVSSDQMHKGGSSWYQRDRYVHRYELFTHTLLLSWILFMQHNSTARCQK